ncbi:GPI-GlcNAc transferase complex, PIG-H component-domain-containing protein [Mucor lusitanicus]|uniref:GPI-GlcNAc transferase complex, PIG-H component-domain-containing protein n=1 Tax=Mucor circinelloides f. lusitanicus TaxID=29924 RepID=A0A8H4BDI3_MUCCL|nr:GPI-GlcNAc transferase complex, PIG-H component-domain-containing protein [Mucor lusitanicus]
MTCRILPGMQAREYIVKSSSNPIHLLDVFVWSVALYLAQSQHYKYATITALIWLFLKRKSVRQESILAIRDVGIQVKTTYWGGSSVSRFINRNKIDDVIINEGISFWQIKSYMAILVKDEDKMVVVFEHLLPRLKPVLLRAYQGTRTIIFTQKPNHVLDSFYTSKQ